MQIVCIVCPNGCRMEVTVGEKITVSGNKCKRGEAFAVAELTCPKRSVTTSVKTTVKGYPVVSVRTDGEIDKSKVSELCNMLAEMVLTKPLPIGSVVLSDVFGSGVNVVTTTDMAEYEDF